ncbi:MAG TPA: hypothetical protein VI876_03375 [Dehalococcoidia bacterium]|nr:hypothetical protein [Dehalococcoidia bacterium]
MIGPLTLRHRSETQHSTDGDGPNTVLESGKLAFRRYLLVSSGISSTALGLALIVSFFATSYGSAAVAQLAVTDASSVHIVTRGEVAASLLLDETPPDVATPEPAPAVESVAAQAPAPAIDFDPRGEPSQEPTVQPTPQPAVTLGRAIRPPGAAAVPTPAATARPAVVSRPAATTAAGGRIENVNLTFYDCLDQGFCGNMKSGTKVYEGAAACSWNLPEGTRFRILNDPTKRIYVCEDRGILDDTWVDIFFYDPEDGWAWQKAVGRYGAIEIVKLP